MSTDSEQQNGPAQAVVDEEGTVDQKLKSRIIRARERVDQREDLLFVQAPADPEVNRLDRETQLIAWGTSVRQYIRAIRPILKAADVNNARKYWKEETIGKRTVAPPDGEYPWSRFAMDGVDDTHLAQEMGLPTNFDPPQPKVVTFQGLKDVLERHQIDLSWHFAIDRGGLPNDNDRVTLSLSLPVPKDILESAVSMADEFLQNAGIGLEIDKQGTDMIREFDMSGDEPNARYTTGDYESNPEI